MSVSSKNKSVNPKTKRRKSPARRKNALCAKRSASAAVEKSMIENDGACSLDANSSIPELFPALAADVRFREGYVVQKCRLRVAGVLRNVRKKSGLTQRQLAELIGSTQETISRLESCKGSANPTVETLSKIADACGEKFQLSFP